MYSKKQFKALEGMCRAQTALARNEMEFSAMNYWRQKQSNGSSRFSEMSHWSDRS
jgi:hypothetical protein